MAERDPYVIVELRGRLGNQLFQFASGLGIARARDARLLLVHPRIPPEELLLPALVPDLYAEPTKRELMGVGQFAYAVPPKRLLESMTRLGVRAARRLARRGPPHVRYLKDAGRYRPEAFGWGLPVYLRGYFESERYFSDVADDLVAAITWPSTVPDLPAPSGANVAVSFRRGDYNTLGRSLPIHYYDRAIEHIVERVPTATLVLFGDDAGFVQLAGDRWAAHHPVLDAHQIASDPVSQLHLMTRCDHWVIANSTFAWWGAWLGERRVGNASSIVVAPAEFGGPDRVPERWATVESGLPPI